MRIPHFRVRTLLIAVAIVAVLIWCGLMSVRSYRYHQWAMEYSYKERGWREIYERRQATAKKDLKVDTLATDTAVYFAKLAQKYRRATWRPWIPIDPDPIAPVAEEYIRTHPGIPTGGKTQPASR